MSAITGRQSISEETKTSTTTITQAANTFAIGVYRKLAVEEGNVFFSPGSIHAALSMTYAGARNRTASQMYRTLGFSLTVIKKPSGSRKGRLDDIIQHNQTGAILFMGRLSDPRKADN